MIPSDYNELRQRLLDVETPLDRRADLLNDLWNIAFIEGKIAGSTELRDRLNDVFTTPLLEQSIENAIARKSVQP